MTDRYLLVLSGGGDTTVALVTKPYWDWITRTDTPGRVGKESSWMDTSAPTELVEQQKVSDQEFSGFDVTIGSYENDRALHVVNGDDVSGVDSFDSVTEALKFVKAGGLTVVDEYHGCIY